MKGYKVFEPDWTCRNFQYEVGKTYQMAGNPIPCLRGFHFCERPVDCFNYYAFDPDNKVAEVIALGKIGTEGDKSCTDKIQIVREIPWDEMLRLVNIGNRCTGMGNTGDDNSGDWNTGRHNEGHRNTGNSNDGNENSGDNNDGKKNSGDFNYGYKNSGGENRGDYNSGDMNVGRFNSGSRNVGGFNSGVRNMGDTNSGSLNIGNRNAGELNIGDHNVGNGNMADYCTGNHNSGHNNVGSHNKGRNNTGCCNIGHDNSGDWNLTSSSSGCFNTEKKTIDFFDKPSDMTLDEWRSTRAYRLLIWANTPITQLVRQGGMTVEEMEANPEYKTLRGYIKPVDRPSLQTWWDELMEFDKELIKQIPNFDPEKFKAITGINVNKESAK